MELRDYQQEAIDKVRDAMSTHKRVLLVSPTGSGKTACFSFIARGVFQKQRRVLIIAHRKELIRQIGEALTNWGVPYGVIGKHIPHANVLIGSVFTVVRRVDKIPSPDLLICDEAHHLTKSTTFGRVSEAYPNARLLGVTATPCRLDGRGLGECFDVMVMGPSVSYLTDLKYLSPTEVFAPSMPDLSHVHRRMGDFVTSELEAEMNKPKITGNAVQHYIRHCPNGTAIVFCVSIAHSKAVAEEFRAFNIAAESVDGKMPEAVRDGVLNGLRNGTVKVVTSCDLISEGFDAPAVDCAILLRPTKSLALFLQQCGRAIRVAPGKEKTIILDHAGNTIEHGFIDEDREWTLDGGAPKKKKKGPSVRTCPRCFAAHRPAPECPACGFSYVPKDREQTLDYVEGDLVKVVDPKSLRKSDVLGTDANKKEYDYLVRTARAKGYAKPEGWAYVVMRAREAKRRNKKAARVG